MDAVCGPNKRQLRKRARTPGELLAVALLASSQATSGDLKQTAGYFLTSTHEKKRILKRDSLQL